MIFILPVRGAFEDLDFCVKSRGQKIPVHMMLGQADLAPTGEAAASAAGLSPAET